MFDWLINIFKNPKTLIRMAVDALDTAAPLLAAEIERTGIMKKTPLEMSQFSIDWVQKHLYKLFKL